MYTSCLFRVQLSHVYSVCSLMKMDLKAVSGCGYSMCSYSMSVPCAAIPCLFRVQLSHVYSVLQANDHVYSVLQANDYVYSVLQANDHVYSVLQANDHGSESCPRPPGAVLPCTRGAAPIPVRM